MPKPHADARVTELRVALTTSEFERLDAYGATLVHGSIDTPWGDRTVRFEDPDGMQVTLYEPPKEADAG